jgi:hypothetical protein
MKKLRTTITCPICGLVITHTGDLDVNSIMYEHIFETHEEQMWKIILKKHMNYVKAVLMRDNVCKKFGKFYCKPEYEWVDEKFFKGEIKQIVVDDGLK